MEFPHVNYLAVLVSGVVIFMLGGLWYSKALFARRWMALMGKTEEECREASGPMAPMLAQAFLCGLLQAWVLAVILSYMPNPTAGCGIATGALCWLGFAAATSWATSLFSMQSRGLWVINSGFNLVSFVLAGLILGAWR